MPTAAGIAVPQRVTADAPVPSPRRTVANALPKSQQHRLRQLHHRFATRQRSPSRRPGSVTSPGIDIVIRERAHAAWKPAMKDVSLTHGHIGSERELSSVIP